MQLAEHTVGAGSTDRALRVLFLPNWPVRKRGDVSSLQRPDFVLPGQAYWFFEHFTDPVQVDVIDARHWAGWRLEERFLHFYLAQGLIALRRARRYDAVLVHGAQSAVVLLAIARLFRLNLPPVVVIDVGAFNGGRPERRLSFGLVRWAMARASSIVWHSESARTLVSCAAPELASRGEYVPFGVDEREFSHVAAADGDYVVCVGYAQRDWKTLLEAWCMLPGIALKLVGVPAGVADGVANVEVLPRVPFEEYLKIVADARLVVLPVADGEASWGQMTLLQAMALGKPVVVTDVAPVADYLGEWCVRVGPENPAQLAHAVSDLYNDAEARAHLGKLACEASQTRFNERSMALRIETLIRSHVQGMGR